MTDLTRREWLGSVLTGAAAVSAPASAREGSETAGAQTRWARGIEGQRKADLGDHIDPGHIVGEEGKRYLFLSAGDRVRLRDDGLATDGPVEHVYDPWKYPEDWVVETFAPEGPKLLRHGDWFYMITAVGGTAGPPTIYAAGRGAATFRNVRYEAL